MFFALLINLLFLVLPISNGYEIIAIYLRYESVQLFTLTLSDKSGILQTGGAREKRVDLSEKKVGKWNRENLSIQLKSL